MKSNPLISISIVSHGQDELLKRLIESIRASEETAAFEFILTENLRDHGDSLLILRSENVTLLINDRPKSFSANHNHAFKRSSGDFFCVLNPDVIFKRELLPDLFNHVDQGNGDIVAPLVVNSDHRPQDSFRSLPSPSEILQRNIVQRSHTIAYPGPSPIYPDWIAAIFLLMRAETYLSLDGFDEKFSLYFEDVDFGTRARLRGFKLMVDPKHHIIHDAARSSHQKPSYLLKHFSSAVKFFSSGVYRKARRLDRSRRKK
jgi:GT2 family glycosyltransferase